MSLVLPFTLIFLDFYSTFPFINLHSLSVSLFFLSSWPWPDSTATLLFGFSSQQQQQLIYVLLSWLCLPTQRTQNSRSSQFSSKRPMNQTNYVAATHTKKTQSLTMAKKQKNTTPYSWCDCDCCCCKQSLSLRPSCRLSVSPTGSLRKRKEKKTVTAAAEAGLVQNFKPRKRRPKSLRGPNRDSKLQTSGPVKNKTKNRRGGKEREGDWERKDLNSDDAQLLGNSNKKKRIRTRGGLVERTTYVEGRPLPKFKSYINVTLALETNVIWI